MTSPFVKREGIEKSLPIYLVIALCGLWGWPLKVLLRGAGAPCAPTPHPWAGMFRLALGSFFLLCFRVLFPSSVLNWVEGRAVVNATLAQAIYWRIFPATFETTAQGCRQNLLLALGLRPEHSATTQTTI